MPHRIGKMQSNGSLWSMILFWWSVLQTCPIPTDSENLLSDCTSYLIDGPEQIDPLWVKEANAVAQLPVHRLLKMSFRLFDRLRELGVDTVVQEDGVTESIQFSLPKELKLRVVD